VAEKTINNETVEAPVAETVPRERRRRSAGSRADRSINMDELRELIALIRDNELAEFELEHQGFRVRLRREEAGRFIPADAEVVRPSNDSSIATQRAADTRGVAAVSPMHPGAQAETAASEDQDLHIITSPIVGTFYRAPSPNADSFVKIGTVVEPDSVVCIIEAMKLMNEIQAETSGEVAKIYVENGQPVEYGQPLFGIKQ
jgi:acetyl-CoA carboxylase biotin carboxyl carrier protein